MKRKPDFKQNRIVGSKRRGVATLEFVIAMPTLFLLMVGIVWLGYSNIYQAEVAIEARNDAWRLRYENPDANPLIFPTLPIYDHAENHRVASSSKRVDVSPVFSGTTQPSSEYSTLSGAWDHRSMPMDDLPDWKLFGKSLLNSKTGNLQEAFGNLQNFQDLAKSLASNLIKQALGSAFVFQLSDNIKQSQTTQSQVFNAEKQQAIAATRQKLKEVDAGLQPIYQKLGSLKPLTPAEQRKRTRLEIEKRDLQRDLSSLNKNN